MRSCTIQHSSHVMGNWWTLPITALIHGLRSMPQTSGNSLSSVVVGVQVWNFKFQISKLNSGQTKTPQMQKKKLKITSQNLFTWRKFYNLLGPWFKYNTLIMDVDAYIHNEFMHNSNFKFKLIRVFIAWAIPIQRSSCVVIELLG